MVDVCPTILDVTGVQSETSSDGQSLVPLLEGKTAGVATAYFLSAESHALRDRNMKLIRNINTGRFQLFDLGADPKELKDLYAPSPETDVLQRMLETFYHTNQYAWRIHLMSESDMTSFTVSLVSKKPFIMIRQGFTSQSTALLNGEHRLDAQVRAWHREPSSMLVKSLEPSTSIDVSITADKEYFFIMGGQQHPGAKQNRVSLADDVSLANALLPPPTAEQLRTTSPFVAIWHGGELSQISGQGLSDENVKQLKSLGYL
jgi:hypothetical protein